MDSLLKPAALPILALLTAAIATSAQAGDAAKGQTVFLGECSICHSVATGAPKGIGPNLHGVVGRKAGSADGYTYSSAMRAAGFTWSDAQLHTYLPAPSKLVSGTKMTYGGLKDPAKLDNLISYLDTLK
jgi:cytochrome c